MKISTHGYYINIWFSKRVCLSIYPDPRTWERPQKFNTMGYTDPAYTCYSFAAFYLVIHSDKDHIDSGL